MSDVADMLGLSAKPSSGNLAMDEAQKIMGEKVKVKGVKKPKGMSREVFDLLGKDGLAPAAQANVIVPSFKNKRSNALKGKWVWTHINSSARENNQPVFFHWIKAEQTYVDYPYASFNVKFDTFTYSDEEYAAYLNEDTTWSKEDTDILVRTCHRFDLRWPVVSDRISLSTPRTVEDMQQRYYSVRSTLLAKRQEQAGIVSISAPGTFNVEQERKRRRAQDMLFKKTKEDEAEESQLREELKAIDAALKKNKKAKSAATATDTTQNAANQTSTTATTATTTVSLGPGLVPRTILAAPGAGGVPDSSVVATAAAGSGSAATKATPSPTEIVATGPVKRRPALQSSRLYSGTVPPINLSGSLIDYGVTKADTGYVGAALSKKMLHKMILYLRELEIPENPLPTKDVCDMVEQIKLGTITLLSLHNLIARKEKELAALQSGGTVAEGTGADMPGPKSKASRAVKKEAVSGNDKSATQVSTEESAMAVDTNNTVSTVSDLSAAVEDNNTGGMTNTDNISKSADTIIVKTEGNECENNSNTSSSSSAMCVDGTEEV